MEQARTFLTTYLSWIRPSTFALLVGVVTTISTVIGATSNAVPVVLKTLNLPDCLTYADVYRGTQADARIGAPPLPPQPLTVQELGAGTLHGRQSRSERDRLAERFFRAALAQQRLAAGQQRPASRCRSRCHPTAEALQPRGGLVAPIGPHGSLHGVGHDLERDEGIVVGMAGAGDRKQPLCCLGRQARGQVDEPECPLSTDGREQRAAPLAQRQSFFYVVAGILLMAPGGFGGGHVHQVPA